MLLTLTILVSFAKSAMNHVRRPYLVGRTALRPGKLLLSGDISPTNFASRGEHFNEYDSSIEFLRIMQFTDSDLFWVEYYDSDLD